MNTYLATRDPSLDHAAFLDADRAAKRSSGTRRNVRSASPGRAVPEQFPGRGVAR